MDDYNAREVSQDDLKTIRAALYNVPPVGEVYDQQHSDQQIRAILLIDNILGIRHE